MKMQEVLCYEKVMDGEVLATSRKLRRPSGLFYVFDDRSMNESGKTCRCSDRVEFAGPHGAPCNLRRPPKRRRACSDIPHGVLMRLRGTTEGCRACMILRLTGATILRDRRIHELASQSKP